MEGAAHVNWIEVILAFFNFGVLVFILIRYGGPGINSMLAKRHHSIRTELESARALREQAEARLREYEARLRNIEDEIARLEAGIRAEAEAEAGRIIAAAKEAAARLGNEADFLAKQEVRKLEIELRRESANAVVEAARKLLAAKVEEADQRRLVDQFVRQMGQPTAPARGARTDS
jgi:F-type H+-transporting ATPase subunit b